MINRMHAVAFATVAMMGIGLSSALAVPSPAFQNAILADLSPETRAEIQGRATGGRTVQEVLETVLLNNLQVAGAPLAKVVAVDFGRSTAVVEADGSPMRVVHFDPRTLKVAK